MSQLEMELEEERNNSDLLSERISRSREQVLWLLGGLSCMEKEMWALQLRTQREEGEKVHAPWK